MELKAVVEPSSHLHAWQSSATMGKDDAPALGALPCLRSADAAAPDVGKVSWTIAPYPRLIFGGRKAPLSTLQHSGVRQCLRNRRIVFIGDSLTRYQYLNLAHFVARGRWDSDDSRDWQAGAPAQRAGMAPKLGERTARAVARAGGGGPT